MARRLIYAACLVILMLSASLWQPPAAYACTCAPSPPLQERVRGTVRAADAVFIGKVIAITDMASISGVQKDNHIAVQFEVQRTWKGPDHLQITTYMGNRNPSMCDTPFVTGESYLVYAYTFPEDGRLHASMNICGLTRNLTIASASEQLNILNQDSGDNPGVPRAGQPGEHILPVLLAPFLAIALGLILTLSQSRSKFQ
jgi:hypothetical protein